MKARRAAAEAGLCPSVPTARFNAYSMHHITGVRYAGHNDHELEAALRRGAELRCFAQQSLRTGAPVKFKEAQSLKTWENQGGQSALSTAPVRILIVDDDIKASDSLELMLNASGYSQTALLTPAKRCPLQPGFSPPSCCSSSVCWI